MKPKIIDEESLLQTDKIVWFKTICEKNLLAVSDEQFDQLENFVNLLLDWNKKINLISRKDEENIWTYHMLHCISPLFKIELQNKCKVVDIGTGGGLPGVPLKILRPDISLLCIDSTRKKINAVAQIINDLGLINAEVVWGRAEEIGVQQLYVHKFDFAIARAVAPLKDLIYWSSGFLKIAQRTVSSNEIKSSDKIIPLPPALLSYKGGDLTDEIEAATKAYPKIKVDVIDLVLSDQKQPIESDKKILIVQM